MTSAKSFKTLAALVIVGSVMLGGFMLSSANGQSGQTSPAGLPVQQVVIVKQDGSRDTFRAEIATKPMDLQVGLMHRKSLDKDAGMLFYFGGGEGEISFWMKNTLIPLDMIFIRADGSIAHIHEKAVPESLASVPSRYPVAAVLEINGGESAARGIKPGDRVEHAFFHAAQQKEEAPTVPPQGEPAPLPDALPDTRGDDSMVPDVIDELQNPGLESETGQP